MPTLNHVTSCYSKDLRQPVIIIKPSKLTIIDQTDRPAPHTRACSLILSHPAIGSTHSASWRMPLKKRAAAAAHRGLPKGLSIPSDRAQRAAQRAAALSIYLSGRQKATGRALSRMCVCPCAAAARELLCRERQSAPYIYSRAAPAAAGQVHWIEFSLSPPWIAQLHARVHACVWGCAWMCVWAEEEERRGGIMIGVRVDCTGKWPLPRERASEYRENARKRRDWKIEVPWLLKVGGIEIWFVWRWWMFGGFQCWIWWLNFTSDIKSM